MGGLALAAALLVAPSAWAHLMPAGKGTVNLVGSKAYLVVSLPLAAFEADDGSGVRMTSALAARSQAALKAQIRAGLSLWSGEAPGTIEEIVLSVPDGADHLGDAGAELVAMLVIRFSEPPKSLRLVSRLWADGADGLRVKATESQGKTTVRAEVGELSADTPEFLFFATDGEVLLTSFVSGLGHLAVGLDHLLFFVLLLLAHIAGWRWFRVVGSLVLAFVAAFYTTMTVDLGLSPAWVEWGIALTVLVVAVAARHASRGRAARWEWTWISALGVLHGLGFAAASAHAGFAAHLPWVKLAGVSLAVLAGLVMVAALVAGVLWVGRRTVGETFAPHVGLACQILGVVAGTYWVVERALQI